MGPTLNWRGINNFREGKKSRQGPGRLHPLKRIPYFWEGKILGHARI